MAAKISVHPESNVFGVPYLELIDTCLQSGCGYTIDRLINHGSYGRIYQANDVKSNKKVAIKVEKHQKRSRLKKEYIVYVKMGNSSFTPMCYGFHPGENFDLLILEILGPNLRAMWFYNHKKFSTKTILLITIQTLNIIEYFHVKCHVHGDIKLENFCIKQHRDGTTSIVICDFGFSDEWCDPLTKKHFEEYNNSMFVATPKYASINIHLGKQYSRRDDLESLAYMYSKMIKGYLPWDNVSLDIFNDVNEQILKHKQMKNDLYGPNYQIYSKFLSEVKALGLTDTPNYKSLIDIFEEKYREFKYKDRLFDWDTDFPNYKDYEKCINHEVDKKTKNKQEYIIGHDSINPLRKIKWKKPREINKVRPEADNALKLCKHKNMPKMGKK